MKFIRTALKWIQKESIWANGIVLYEIKNYISIPSEQASAHLQHKYNRGRGGGGGCADELSSYKAGLFKSLFMSCQLPIVYRKTPSYSQRASQCIKNVTFYSISLWVVCLCSCHFYIFGYLWRDLWTTGGLTSWHSTCYLINVKGCCVF